MKSKIIFLFILLLFGKMNFAQTPRYKSETPLTRASDCFKGIYYKVITRTWLPGGDPSDDFEYQIVVTNNYNKQVSFDFDLKISDEKNTNGGRFTLEPGASTNAGIGYRSSSKMNWNTLVKDVCFNNGGCSKTARDGSCYAQCDNGSPNTGNCGNTSNNKQNQNYGNQTQSSNPNQVNTNDFQGLINDLNSNCQKLGMVMNLNTGSPVYNKYCKEGKTYEPTTSNKNYLAQAISEIKQEKARFDKEFGYSNDSNGNSQQNAYAAQQEAQRQQEEAQRQRQEAQQRENERRANYKSTADRANVLENSGDYDGAIAAYNELYNYAGNDNDRKLIRERIEKIKKNKRYMETVQNVKDALTPLAAAWDKARADKLEKEKIQYRKDKEERERKASEEKAAGLIAIKDDNSTFLEDKNFLSFFSYGQSLLKEAGILEPITKFVSTNDTKTIKIVIAMYGNDGTQLLVSFYREMQNNGNYSFSKEIEIFTKPNNEIALRKAIAASSVSNLAQFNTTKKGSFHTKISFSNDASYTTLIPEEGVQEAKNIFLEQFNKKKGEIKNDGSNESYLKLGKQYLMGSDGVTMDIAKAISTFTKCADKGDSKCMYYLGTAYNSKGWDELKLSNFNENEKLNNQNLKNAFQWYQKAAESGNGSAYSQIGDAYGKGLGVEKNLYKKNKYLDKANAYYAKDCNDGNKFSCDNLKYSKTFYSGKYNRSTDYKVDFGSKPQGRPVLVFFNFNSAIQSFSGGDSDAFELTKDEDMILRASLKEEFKGKVNTKINVVLSNGEKKELKIKGEVKAFVPFRENEQ